LKKALQNTSYKVEKLHENGDRCPYYFNRGKAIKIGGKKDEKTIQKN
jgi:hypothetical protein